MKILRKLFFLALIGASAITAEAQTLRLPADFKGNDPSILAKAHAPMRDMLPLRDNPFLSPLEDDADDIAGELLDYAHKFLGTRYRRGGKTPAGFDCSGFTGHVFRQFGYELSASSRSQFTDGKAVPTDEIQPGDLLFFNGRARNGSVGHVGIAVSADPLTGVVTFIHASVSGGIKVDKTTDPYYAARFMGARRILPD